MQIKNYKKLRIYSLKSGKEPFSDWLTSIRDRITRARIRSRLDRVEAGNYGDHKALGDGVYEMRLQFGSGYRIYFAELDDAIVILLCGGDKSTQSKDIKTAKRYWQELQESSNE